MKQIFILMLIISTCLVKLAHTKSKYYDGEIRAYNFGYSIEGHQHRHEEKDEKGQIMGEFGFVTGDGVYHVTGYATDEDGNFKILFMRNIKIGLPGDPDSKPVPKTVTDRPAIVAGGRPPQPAGVINLKKSSFEVNIKIPESSKIPACSSCSIPKIEAGVNTVPSTPFNSILNKDKPQSNKKLFSPLSQRLPPVSSVSRAPVGSLDAPVRPSLVTFPASPSVTGVTPLKSSNIQGPETIDERFGTSFPTPNQQPGTQPLSRVGVLEAVSPPRVVGPTSNAGQLATIRSSGAAGRGAKPLKNAGQLENIGISSPLGTLKPISNAVLLAKTATSNPVAGFRPSTQAKLNLNTANQFNAVGDTSLAEKPRPFSNARQLVNTAPITLDTRTQVPSPTTNSVNQPAYEKPTRKSPGQTTGFQLINGILYKFNYTVGYHGHHEQGDSQGAKDGGYYFIGRDGLKRTVEYTANEFGFQPHIRTGPVDPQDVPHEDTEKEAGLKGFEFKWFNL